MNATFVLSPLLIMLLIGIVVGFILLMTKLFKNNPQAAIILLILPIAGIAGFVLLNFFESGSSHSVPYLGGASDGVPTLWFSALMLFTSVGVIVGFIILMIKLLKNNPKTAAMLLIVPVALILLSIILPTAHRVRVSQINNRPLTQLVNAERLPNNPSPDHSPIWSEGIENEFEADVYPSKIAAVRELGRKIKKSLPLVIEAFPSIQEIEIFQNSQDLELVEEFQKVVAQFNPDIKCKIVFENPTFSENIIVISFLINVDYYSIKQVSWQNNPNDNIMSGTIRANILVNQKQQVSVPVSFSEKPWVENFSSFINNQPNKDYIVTKSNETSLSPEEAERQAMNQAVNQVASRLLRYLNPNSLESKDIIASGILVDKFIQSFDGSAGKIWRQAILLDVSQAKLQHLANMISNVGRERKMTWARMISSIVGLFILITIAYAFLNAATRGYYSLTLKIVGIILAAIFLFIILTLS